MNEREALLEALRDPRPLEGGGWLPAPGWWLLGVAVLLLALLGPRLAHAWRERQARRRAGRDARRRAHEARTRLAALRVRAEAGEAPAVLGEASVLARQLLLALRSRHEVAALHGERWLHALDAASGGTAFTRGPGRLLESGPYRAGAAASGAELLALLDALEGLTDKVGTPRAAATRTAHP